MERSVPSNAHLTRIPEQNKEKPSKGSNLKGEFIFKITQKPILFSTLYSKQPPPFSYFS